MNLKKLAIIGGGASAFFCAANLNDTEKNKNLSITIFEQSEKLMLKLLATGGGRCNISNFISDNKLLVKYYPRGEKFLYSVFEAFSVRDTIDWFENNGVSVYKELDNCIFPKANNAKVIANTLLKKLPKLRTDIRVNSLIREINMNTDKFTLYSDKSTEEFDIVLICTGGQKNITKKVKYYYGYKLAKDLGHTIIMPNDSLCPMITGDKNISQLAGITISAVKLTASYKNVKLAEYTGDILFTHSGISGPGVLNLSAKIATLECVRNDSFDVLLKCTDYRNINDAQKALLEKFLLYKNKNILNILTEYYPKNLARFILEKIHVLPEKKVHSITKLERKKIAENLVYFKIPIEKLDKNSSMVTAGGVSLKEINASTMESKIHNNLYFAGEVLNVDGLCGGFNLQFAWSSSYIAAKSILQALNT